MNVHMYDAHTYVDSLVELEHDSSKNNDFLRLLGRFHQ